MTQSSLPKNVKKPHFAAHRNSRPRRILKPAKDGSLEVMELSPDIEHLKPATLERGDKKKARVRNRLVVFAGQGLGAKGLKELDIVAFNTKAEEFFVFWLSEAVAATHGEGRAIGWVLANAAFELDVSTETAKRYLAKHTAERAEFTILNGKVFLKGE